MKILLLDNSHLPLIGGKEIVVHHLAKQFTKFGHDVRVAGPAGARSHRKCELGYRVDRYPSFPVISNDTQWALRTKLILRNRSYDIVHAHTTHPCGYHAQRVLLGRSSAPPLVVTPHGADIHKVPEIGFGKRLDPALEKKIEWLLKNCAGATAISEAVRDSLIDAGMDEQQIVDIPNGVDIDRMTKVIDFNAREALGLKPDCHLVVTVGNYHKRKGHEVLAKAISQCKSLNVHLVIVGRKSKVLESFLEDSNLAAHVTFTGMLKFPTSVQVKEPDLLVALLQQATCYVSSSMAEGTEGLSLALLEAMAAGAPIIATNVSGNQDIIDHEKNGLLVKPNSSEEIASSIDTLIAKPEIGNELSKSASELIREYSWEQTAKRYLSFYESVMRRESSKR